MFLFVTLFLAPALTHAANCKGITKETLKRDMPYVVRGTVHGYEEDKSSLKIGVHIVRFELKVLEVLKGETKADPLHIEYQWVNEKDTVKRFREGEEVVLPVSKIENTRAYVDIASCVPKLTAKDFAK